MPIDPLLGVGREPRTPYAIQHNDLNDTLTINNVTPGPVQSTVTINNLPRRIIGFNVSVVWAVAAGTTFVNPRISFYLNSELISGYALPRGEDGGPDTYFSEFIYVSRDLWGSNGEFKVILTSDSVAAGSAVATINVTLISVLI
jgi:hypothetical protein